MVIIKATRVCERALVHKFLCETGQPRRVGLLGYATCQTPKDVGIQLSASNEDTTNKVADLLFAQSPLCSRPNREAAKTIFSRLLT